MIQVYNSKAVGAEDVELGTRVRSHVPNVILQIYSLGIATISGAPSARVCTRASEIVFRFLVYRYHGIYRVFQKLVPHFKPKYLSKYKHALDEIFTRAG